MAHFVQPQNREADLQAILEGYEGRIEHQYWLSDAFQKDGVQNSWDARTTKKGHEWFCTLFYKESTDKKIKVLGIMDEGTTGLTGTIPENQEQAVKSLTSENSNERLAYFLSSNWSKKAEDALGSRGRGKMIFIGASLDRTMYFDSIRIDDDEYVFGKTYLDENKAISVEVYKGEEADRKREEVFGNLFKRLNKYGTRILIPNPQSELIEAFQNGFTEEQIRCTWWEILHKYNANIILDNNGWIKKVDQSQWMPVEGLGIKETETFELQILPKNPHLRIKKISLCYLGEKELPDAYTGISIQRFGMVVERISASRLIGENIGDKIIGSVELEKELESEIRDNEGPEHYNIFWNRTIPSQLRILLKEKALLFARKYKLMEEERISTNREQRQAEVAAQRELNELAKTLGFTLGHQIAPKNRNKKTREPDENIRLSTPDFKTPYESGRVDTGQTVEGTYAIPIAEMDDSFKVLVRAWLIYKDESFHKDGKEFKIEKEIDLPTNNQIRVGWENINIDKDFEKGKYSFRAKMIAMEDKALSTGVKIEKGQEIYGPISRTFYVNEDPEEKGIFKFQRASKYDKSKYYWWSFEDNTWIIYYNGEHPVFKPITDDPDLLKEELRRIGILVAFAIMCSVDSGSVEEGKRTKVFPQKDLRDASFDELLQQVIDRQSEILWDKAGK